MRVLDRNSITVNSSIKDKDELMTALAEAIYSDSTLPKSIDLKNAFLEREEEMSTGIGLGVAIPHVRVADLAKPKMIIIQIPKGVTHYKSIDGKPVILVFALLSPLKDPKSHCQILKDVTQMVQIDKIREELITADNSDLFYSIIKRKSTLAG